jgi:hypothetical protein
VKKAESDLQSKGISDSFEERKEEKRREKSCDRVNRALCVLISSSIPVGRSFPPTLGIID